ncbi:MAG TPA: transcription antitermination factor NusB [Bacillota bacterium]|nr:transcription antitermination factor NusB [Bacillota bacterium]
MTRTKSRELLMQLLFLMEVQKDFTQSARERFYRDQEIIGNEFMDLLFNHYLQNNQEIDTILDQCADNWTIQRINKVDLAILRLATTELLFMRDVPSAVIINEAVNMAKKYGIDDSGKFVNGVLGSIYKKHIKDAFQ